MANKIAFLGKAVVIPKRLLDLNLQSLLIVITRSVLSHCLQILGVDSCVGGNITN